MTTKRWLLDLLENARASVAAEFAGCELTDRQADELREANETFDKARRLVEKGAEEP